MSGIGGGYPAGPAWSRLQAVIGGQVLLAGTAGYEAARRPALARFAAARPAAVVRAGTAEDVAAVIGFARRHGLSVSPRAGGHCFAGRSSAGDIVLDLAAMRSVAVAEHGVATVGAGTLLGELDEALAAHGRAVPTGCGRGVGIAGLTLGGGMGLLGRRYGLTCDRLVQARVVLADGRILDCDDRRHPDLFWALRGAGGGQFGVVTSLAFATVPAPALTCFRLSWPASAAATVTAAWQSWAPAARDELTAELRLTACGDRVEVDVVGAHLVTDAATPGEHEAATGRVLDELTARIGARPAGRHLRTKSYRDGKDYLADAATAQAHPAARPDPADAQARIGDWVEYSKSEFFRQPLPEHTISALVDMLTTTTTTSATADRGAGAAVWRRVSFTPWGGAYNRVAESATAFAHRGESFLLEHLVRVHPGAPAGWHRAARTWLAGCWAVAHPWGTGRVYPNFPDPDLPDWAHAYHAGNYLRLTRVQRHYDPDAWFSFPQSLASPPPDGHRHTLSHTHIGMDAGGMARAATTTDVFNAVGDPGRRQILDALSDGERSVTELVERLRMSQPQVSKHLRVLREVAAVRVRDEGRQRMYSLNGPALRPIHDWIAVFEQTWTERYDRLDQLLVELESEEQEHDDDV
jgi:FAD/FMN-containing dehydrogenase/DNA-binding transcriptional ArsR family regulator